MSVELIAACIAALAAMFALAVALGATLRANRLEDELTAALRRLGRLEQDAGLDQTLPRISIGDPGNRPSRSG